MKFLRNSLLMVALLALFQSSFAQNTDAINYGPSTVGHVISSSPLALGDLLRNYNSDSSVAVAGQAGYGVVWTGSNFIVSNFNANLFYRYDINWVKRDSFAVSGGLGFFRDMAFAKGLLWGVNNTTNPGQIIGIDTGSKAVVKTITTTLVGLRGLTWDPARQGFWCGTNSFSGPAVCVDTNGTAIVGATFAPGSIYGIGYDPNPAGTPMITISRDMTPANTTQTVIARYNATTFAKVDSVVVTVPLQTPATSLASGGEEVYTNLIPGKRVSLGLVQSTPHRVIVVDLGDLPLPPLAQDFSSATFPPPGWSLNIGSAATQYWSLSPVSAFQGAIPGSAKYNFYNATAATGPQTLTSNQFSPLALGGNNLRFNYSNAYYNATSVDSCIIETSSDAGTTWTRLIAMYSSPTLTTGTNNSPIMSTFVQSVGAFTPTLASQWATKIFAVPVGTNMVRFVAKSGFGNNLYIDDVTSGTATGVGNPISLSPDTYNLSQNYPNPFNPSTKISFNIPENGLVSLKVYDMTGKEVADLVNSNMSKGSYSVDFNASKLSSGIYFYTIKAGNFSDTKKMMLVK